VVSEKHPTTAVIRDAVPGLFRFDPGRYRCVAALDRTDGVLVGSARLGATDPAVAAGVVYSAADLSGAGSILTVRIALPDGDRLAEVRVRGRCVPMKQYLAVKQ